MPCINKKDKISKKDFFATWIKWYSVEYVNSVTKERYRNCMLWAKTNWGKVTFHNQRSRLNQTGFTNVQRLLLTFKWNKAIYKSCYIFCRYKKPFTKNCFKWRVCNIYEGRGIFSLRTFAPKSSHTQIFLKLWLQVENDKIRLKT